MLLVLLSKFRIRLTGVYWFSESFKICVYYKGNSHRIIQVINCSIAFSGSGRTRLATGCFSQYASCLASDLADAKPFKHLKQYRRSP